MVEALAETFAETFVETGEYSITSTEKYGG